MTSARIDGIEIEASPGVSVLQAALDADIYIPHVCAHEDLPSVGSCGMCVVHIDGVDEAVRACTTELREGMVVTTKADDLKVMRRLAMELMLAGHPAECTGCPVFGNCEFQSLIQYTEATATRLRRRPNSIPPDNSNPLITHDMTRCVMCGRCVRACGDLRGVHALTFVKPANGPTRVGIRGGGSLIEGGCIFCGSCVEVCPTGAIRDKEGTFDATIPHNLAIVPCRTACPAGIDIPRYTRLVREGNPSEALAVIREKVPFPHALGMVCDHLCESSCRRNDLNESLSIRALKRFAAEHGDDSWKEHSRQLPPTGKKVAVVGSGPAGLTAAFYLAKQGHAVVVFEALDEAGGMLRVGIPEYRLPRAIIDNEINEIRAVGVEIRTGTRVETPKDLLDEGYDAVLMAIGAHDGVRLGTPGGDQEGVYLNTEFLRNAATGRPDPVGTNVVVIGGGNVAFDCAGVARRLGATQVSVLCLESRDDMRASDEEITEALDAGTQIMPAVNVEEIPGTDGRVTGVRAVKIRSFRFDNEGRAVLDIVPDSEFSLPADQVIFAVGQRPHLSEAAGLVQDRGRRIVADLGTGATPAPGIFAAGDAVYGTKSVIAAIDSGRQVAIAIDRHLGGDGEIAEELAPARTPVKLLGRKNAFVNSDRTPTEGGLTEEEALEEAGRCLQCDMRLHITDQRFWSAYTHR